MKLLFKSLMFSILLLGIGSMHQASAQCNPVPVSGSNCHAPALNSFVQYEIGDFSSGANCHRFARNYIENGYNIYNARVYDNPSDPLHSTVVSQINTAASGYAEGFFGALVDIVSSANDADGAIYETYYPSHGWVVDHSAVKLGNGAYLSKWESCGPVMQHYLNDIPYLSNSCNYSTRTRFWKWKTSTGGGTVNCNLTTSNCTDCSCDSNGLFLVRAPLGWSNHNWSITPAGQIVWNFGDYVYVKRNPNHSGWPNNDIKVTVTAYKSGCGTRSHTTPHLNLPTSCSSGGGGGIQFFYSVNPAGNALSVDLQDLGENETFDMTMKVVSLYDENGKALGHVMDSKTFDIQLNQPLREGMYIIKVQDGLEFHTRKIYYRPK